MHERGGGSTSCRFCGPLFVLLIGLGTEALWISSPGGHAGPGFQGISQALDCLTLDESETREFSPCCSSLHCTSQAGSTAAPAGAGKKTLRFPGIATADRAKERTYVGACSGDVFLPRSVPSPLFFTVTIHAGSTGQLTIHLQTRKRTGKAACYRMQLRPGQEKKNSGVLAQSVGMEAPYEH